jgi:hypothetical protein
LAIERLIASSKRRMANESEEVQDIPYVFGAINGRHILIIAPPIDPTSYYCQNGSY